MTDQSAYFDDRVTVTVTTTRDGAKDILDGLESTVEDMADQDKTWVTVAPVEKPDLHIVSNQENPNEDSWS